MLRPSTRAIPAGRPVTILLRHWFNEAAQLIHHFHRRENDEVLFFAGPQLERHAPVLLEVAFLDNEQTCVLGGHVAEVDHGVQGNWLSFAEQDVAQGLADAATTRRRRTQRLPTELAINARAGGAVYVCKLVDISLSGARLSGLRGLVEPGMELELSIFGKPSALGQLGGATVVWQGGLDIGVKFQRCDPGARQAVTRLAAETKSAWRTALEARHPPHCNCRLDPGRTWEPPVPKQPWPGPRETGAARAR